MNRRLLGFDLCGDSCKRERRSGVFVLQHYSVLRQHWNNTGGCLRRTIPDPEKQRTAPKLRATHSRGEADEDEAGGEDPPRTVLRTGLMLQK